jgi:hypothetical protein
MKGSNRKLAFRRSTHFGAWLAFSLIVAVCLQAWIFSAILDKTVGPIRNLAQTFRNSPEIRVALLKSGNSALLSEPNPEDYFDAVRQWEIALTEAGVPFGVIADQDLTPEIASNSTVLVLPSAVCLSNEQRAAIHTLAKAGVGIVASGAIGARDANCVWRGWDFLTSVTGVQKPEAAPVTQGAFAIFRGGQYFSEVVPAGFRVELPPQELVFGTVKAPDVYRSDGRLHPAQGDSPEEVALAAHGAYQGSRMVWLGFKETLTEGSGKDQRAALNQYMAHSVLWVGRQPLAAFGNWPNRSRAAVLLAETIDTPESAAPAAAVLRQERVSATYLLMSSKAGNAPAALRRLKEHGEIASGGDTTDAFAEQDEGSQTARLVKARAELEGLGSAPIVGFDPPQQVWDASTVDALRNAGYSYYFDRSEFRRAVPQLIIHKEETKWFLPPREVELARISTSGATDMEVIARYRRPGALGADLADGFVRDFRLTEFVGGLYTLSFRSDLLGAPANTHILRAVIQTMKGDRAWITSGEQLTAWWSQREKVKVESRMISPTRIRIAITNRSSRPMQNASVYVYLPRRPKMVRVIPVMLDRMTPHPEMLNGGDDVLRLEFPVLKPELSYVGLIVMDEK